MAVPHPEKVGLSILEAKHIHRSFHWWFFQLKDLPEKALLQNDMALMDYLWAYWMVEGFQDEAHIRSIKTCCLNPVFSPPP